MKNLEITDGILECDDEQKTESEFELHIDISTSSEDISNDVEKRNLDNDTIKGVPIDPDYFNYEAEINEMIKICPILLSKEYDAYYDDLILKSQGMCFRFLILT